MSITTAASEGNISTPEEFSKQELVQQLYKDLIHDKNTGAEILGKVKWSLDKVKERSGNGWNSEAVADNIAGNLRAIVAEKVAERTPLSKAQIVFKSGDINLEGLTVESPQKVSGANTNLKGDVLGYLLRKSLKEKPMEVFDPNTRVKNNPVIEHFKEQRVKNKAPNVSREEYGRLLRDYMDKTRENTIEQIIQGYTYTPDGEWYKTTVIPDGIIMKGDVAEGPFEVKAYKADELAKLLSIIRSSGKQAIFFKGTAADIGKTYPGADKIPYMLGVDLNSETDFVDIVRSLSEKGEDRDASNLVVLQFPNDIPDNLLIQYGEMVVSYGYKNVVIQKLPLSVQELDVIAKELVNSQWGNLKFQLLKQRNYSDRELKILQNYAES